MELLSDKDLQSALSKLTGWSVTLQNDAIQKMFRFTDFKMCMEFINQIAEQAEKLNHHPEWTNNHSWIKVKLTTNSKSGVTSKDLELAKIMDKIAKKLLADVSL